MKKLVASALIIFLVPAFLVPAAALAAPAETPAPPAETPVAPSVKTPSAKPCKEERAKFCKGTKGEKVVECLKEHIAEVGPACNEHLEKVANKKSKQKPAAAAPGDAAPTGADASAPDQTEMPDQPE